MRKVLKILFIVAMILGIVFSVSNFLSVELKSTGLRGIWADDTGACERVGNECDIAFFEKQ